jgi:hypothetical protein
MKLKSLALLVIAAAFGVAVYFFSVNKNQTSIEADTALIPNLIDELNSVTKFTVTEAGNSLLASVSKTQNGWVVDNRDGYEANVQEIRHLFTNLAEAKLAETKTSNPNNYTKLGVEDVSKEKAQGVLLNIEGLDNPVQIIFGNDGSSGKNTQFVRRIDEKQSWLINKKLNLNRDVTDWLRKDILDIPPERIKSIQIKHLNVSEVNITNQGAETYEFVLEAEVPEGKEVFESEIYQVANALSSLQLRDVKSYEKLNKDVNNPIITTFKTFDGLTVTTTSYTSEIEPYFTVEVKFNSDDVDENVAKNTSSDGSTSDSAIVSDPKAAEELANKSEKRLKGWAYLLPTITKNAMTKMLEGFFIDQETDAE